MKTKIKTLTVNRKRITCRQVFRGKINYGTDVLIHDNGFKEQGLYGCEPVVVTVEGWTSYGGKSAVWRPIPIKTKKPVARGQSVKCYGVLKNGILQPEAFPNYVASGGSWIDKGEKCVPVLITLLNPSRKGK